MGQSNRDIDYRCTAPHHPEDTSREFSRENLRVKRVQFVQLGLNGKVERTRSVGFWCVPCMESDPDYDRPARVASQGYADTRLARKAVS